nr:unnamed protein product [Digitaria exilis]
MLLRVSGNGGSPRVEGAVMLHPWDRAYYEAVAASAWPGEVSWLESEGEEHVFFLGKPECENAKKLMERVVAFIAGE